MIVPGNIMRLNVYFVSYFFSNNILVLMYYLMLWYILKTQVSYYWYVILIYKMADNPREFIIILDY